ncbi:hypothetical protein TNCV_1732201 [Trichonephila clavipes]|nr:hypothetical protein TNCV_1732201 [Trichonephila clavipes]
MGSLMVRASDSRPEGLSSIPMPSNTLRVHTEWRSVVSPSIIPSGNFADLIRIVTCMVLMAKANDRRTSRTLPR